MSASLPLDRRTDYVIVHQFDTTYKFCKYSAGIAFVLDFERFLFTAKTGSLQAVRDGQVREVVTDLTLVSQKRSHRGARQGAVHHRKCTASVMKTVLVRIVSSTRSIVTKRHYAVVGVTM